VLIAGTGAQTATQSRWGDYSALSVDPADDQVLYVAQSSGVPAQRSEDQGVTFTPFADGLENAGFPRDLAITNAGGVAQLLMATSKGSYVTPIPAGVADRIFADGFEGEAQQP